LEWPAQPGDLPGSVEYFCFMRNPGDTAKRRLAARGRGTETSSGLLPFAWEEVTAICVDRKTRSQGARSVVLGRVLRPLRAEISDATRPKISTATRATKMER
jgi:hypothetical protein